MLTLSRTRRCRRLTLGSGLTRGGAIAQRRNGSRFCRQSRVGYRAINLPLLLGQRVIQITLNLNALLPLWFSRRLPLSRVRRDGRQRDILRLRVVCRRGVLGRWLGIIVLISGQVDALLAGSGLLVG